MKIILVDDEKLQLMRLEECVKSVVKSAEIFTYTNPLKALEDNKNTQIDIAFLDIEKIISLSLKNMRYIAKPSLDEILKVDAETKAYSQKLIKQLGGRR